MSPSVILGCVLGRQLSDKQAGAENIILPVSVEE